MRLKTISSLVALFFSSYVQCQNLNFTVKWGQEIEASRKSSLSDIVGFDATGIYAIKSRLHGLVGNKSYTLDHFDNNFAPTKTFDLDIEEDGNECDVSSLLHLKNKLYIFYSYLKKKEKKNVLFVDEIDKNTLQPKKEKRKIGEIDYSGNSNRNSGGFSIRVSRDSSKVLAFYSLPYEKGEPEAFGFNVLDSNLKSIWEKNVTIPYKDGLFDIQSTRVDNDGNVYMLGLLFKDKRKTKRGGEPNYTYEAFAYSNKGNNVKQYTLSLDDRFITDMQIEILNNNLVCAGFYSAKGTYSIRGTYFLAVDLATKAIKTKSFKEFDIDFITQSMSEREARRAKRREEKGKEQELYEYDLDKLLIGKDGSAMLIGEQYYVKVVSSYNGRVTTYTYHYYYNDIIAVKIDPSGQIQWAEKIAKSQHTVNDDGFYSSYALSIVNGKVCLIFNDNPENLDYDGKGRPENTKTKKSVVVIVSLDKNGKQTKQPIFSTVDVDVIVRPKVCEQISNRNVILFGQRGRTQQFAKLSFE
ncbi:MAG: hypothetical protein HYR67_09265 [Bacteroidetes bacterium]|nr:hypothetical protein [Bacteroidota bacterium]